VRILVTVKPRMYRESLALSLHRNRPHFEVMIAPDASLDGQAGGLRPHLLVRNDTDGVDMDLMGDIRCWIEILRRHGRQGQPRRRGLEHHGHHDGGPARDSGPNGRADARRDPDRLSRARFGVSASASRIRRTGISLGFFFVGGVGYGDPLCLERLSRGLEPGANPHLLVDVGEVPLDDPLRKVDS
jgi:hypothetical protein